MSGEDKISNKVQEVKGEVKKRVGGATGDEDFRPRALPTRPRATSSKPARK